MKTLGWLVILCFGASLSFAAEPALRLDLGGGVSLDVLLVRAGEFTQGSHVEEAGRGPDETQRNVRITRDFHIGRTAVTREQWERFVSETGFRSEAETGTSGGFGWDGNALVQKKQFTWRSPGFPQTNEHPVCLVTFPDAQAFCKWLEKKSKRGISLPTEAQWEYACRAGSNTPWHAGDSDLVAWHKGNSGNGTRPVDSKQANAWGLFIGGNVSEWCLDWYAPYPTGPATDPLQENPNLSDKPRRVLRGGSWIRDPKNTRSAARYRADPRSRNADTGFRIVCSTEIIAPPPPLPAVIPNVPKVEVEPGDPPAPTFPRQEPFHRMPEIIPSPGFSIGRLLGGLLCLFIPVAVIVALVRMVARSQTKTSNPFVAPSLVPRVRSAVRKTADGFWIHGDWPVGTVLKLNYVAGGISEMQDLIYRPGPEGQFIFTGASPGTVSVVADGADAVPPPLFGNRDLTEHRGERVSRPPVFPSAY